MIRERPLRLRQSRGKPRIRLVTCEGAIARLAMSEADVIREVFRLAAVEKKSCRTIAEDLKDLKAMEQAWH